MISRNDLVRALAAVLLGAGCAVVAALAPAQTADDVKCKKCVDTRDLGKNAGRTKHLAEETIKGNRIKNGTVREDDLGNTLLTTTTASGFEVVDSQGQVLGTVRTLGSTMTILLMGESGTYLDTRVVQDYLLPRDNALLYQNADCTGEVRIVQFGDEIPLIPNGYPGPDPARPGKLSVFRPDDTAAAASFDHLSSYGQESFETPACVPDNATSPARPAIPEVDAEAFVPPFSLRAAGDRS